MVFNWSTARGQTYRPPNVSTYDFTTVNTTLPHNLIKGKLTELFERTINRDVSLYLPSNEKKMFLFFSLLDNNQNDIIYGHV